MLPRPTPIHFPHRQHGRRGVRYVRGIIYILTAQDYPGVPKLSDDQIEVLRLFDEITYEPGMAIAMDFPPRRHSVAVQLCRAACTHDLLGLPEPQRRRRLLRLWLSRDNGRPVVADFGKNGVVQHRVAPRDGKPEHPDAHMDIGSVSVPRLLS